MLLLISEWKGAGEGKGGGGERNIFLEIEPII